MMKNNLKNLLVKEVGTTVQYIGFKDTREAQEFKDRIEKNFPNKEVVVVVVEITSEFEEFEEYKNYPNVRFFTEDDLAYYSVEIREK